ncbi:uncharacterized protein DSM5745_08583 [Aspergillus mulundensis]|uniref:Virulence plasmid A protein n=1 Tax=Aspergillus mulundensis TaxID=1810919 RepID=A0A3D8R434_9EURO|nr:hypothetical protein DSM5745_08583 [Aspergillus mulundensis]RDW68823.1 hypothetical protein DSM5745_08583 [Aspergillus mulundensis]
MPLSVYYQHPVRPIAEWGKAPLDIYMLANWDIPLAESTNESPSHRRHRLVRQFLSLSGNGREPYYRGKTPDYIPHPGTPTPAQIDEILRPLRPEWFRHQLPLDNDAGMWVRTCYDPALEDKHRALFAKVTEKGALGHEALVLDDASLLENADLDTVLMLYPEQVTNRTDCKSSLFQLMAMTWIMEFSDLLFAESEKLAPEIYYGDGNYHGYPYGNENRDLDALHELRAKYPNDSEEEFLPKAVATWYRGYHDSCIVTHVFVADREALETGYISLLLLDEHGDIVREHRLNSTMELRSGLNSSGKKGYRYHVWEVFSEEVFSEGRVGPAYMPGEKKGPPYGPYPPNWLRESLSRLRGRDLTPTIAYSSIFQPPGNLLSNSDLNLLSNEILPKLLGEESDLAARLKDKLASDRSVEPTLATLKADPDVVSQDLAKVDLLGWVYCLSDSSAVITKFVLCHPTVTEALLAEPSPTRQVLAEYTIRIPAASYNAPRGGESPWLRLREQLFAQEPMSVIRGLISAGKIPVPEGCKDLVLSILQIAADSFGFDFRTGSLRALLATGEDGADAITDKPPVADAPSALRQDATRFLFKLQRLQALVNEPEDIGALLRCGFGSAEDIASKRDDATALIVNKGVPLERAERIYNHSRYIVSRSDDLWTKALALRGTGSNRDVRVASVAPLQTEPLTGGTEINLSTLFGVDAMGCEDCASIMSPAAFFADLLQTLKLNNAIVDGKASDSSLLDELLKRRADLSQLQLSCANTNVLVPYVDLVNEVLESAVWNIEKGTDHQPQVPPIDAEEDDKDEDYLLQPHNTNFSVYSDIVQDCIVPVHVFPYNQAIHSIRSYLTALGTSRLKLLSVFQSPFPITKDAKLVPLVQEALVHARSAEVLNLQHEDVVAAARESFYSKELTEDLMGKSLSDSEYYKVIGRKTPDSSWWGFDTNDAMLEALQKIKDVLLPLSGLSLQDLLAVLRTRYFDNRLTIAIQTDDGGLAPPASKLLGSMRLHVGDAKPLELCDCARLQEFIRIWYKLQWPIEELDAVIFTLATLDGKPFNVTGKTIGLRLLDNLAAVKELTGLLKLSATDLQPFWGDINTHGPNSLFAQLFPKGTLTDEEREAIFRRSRSSLGDDRLSAVLMALEISGDEFKAITEFLGLPIPVDLSLANISALYRISTLCRQLKILPQLYASFLNLFPDGQSIFNDPQTTLKIVQRYPPMQGAAQSWTLDRLLFLINRIPSATDSKCQPSVPNNLRIAQAVRASLDDQALHDGERKLSDENALPDLLDSLIDDREGRSVVLEFIQNSELHDMDGGEAMEFVNQLSAILGSGTATDLCNKICAADSSEARTRVFLNAFLPAQYREKQCQAVLKSLQPFLPNLSLALLKFALTQLIRIPKETLLLADEPGSSETLSGMDVLLQLAQPSDLNPAVTSRGRPPKAAIPGNKSSTGEFSAYIRAPATGRYFILSAVANQPQGCTLDEATLEFKEWATDQGQQGPRWFAQTNPLVGDRWYRLSYPGSKEDLKWQAAETGASKPAAFDRSLLIEELLVLQSGQVIVELMRASIVVDSFRLHASEVEFAAVFQELMASRGEQRLDFNDLGLKDIWDLDTWLVLREDFLNNGATLSLVGLFEWLCSQKAPNSEEEQAVLGNLLADNISQATGWTIESCRDYLEAKYPENEPSEIVELFQEVSVLGEMRAAMLFSRELGLPSLTQKDLFTMARPAWTSIVENDFKNAATLRLAIQNKRTRRRSSDDQGKSALREANDRIRTGQRTALTHCLLGTDYAKKNNVTVPDELYGHFLIDVQMGPELETTRLKQAITSVQLFVQRCTLGLDSVRPEKPESLDRSMLDYIYRYRLWEADRTAFWYPENWVDPTLRDDKTEQFQALESKIMQSKLDEKTINDMIKEYVHSIDDISNLRVETYHLPWNVWRDDAGTSPRTAHIFARTRTLPPSFYYRTVTRPPESTKQCVWTAWSKVGADIPSCDVDADGNRLPTSGSYLVPTTYSGELYVFLPEITSSQTSPEPKSEDDKTTFEDYRTKHLSEVRPIRHWEIRMSYIKLKNGKWSPRAVAPQVIYAAIDTAEDPRYRSDVTNFKFWTDPDQPLTVRVERVKFDGRILTYDILGAFKIRDQQLVLVENSQNTLAKPFLCGPPLTVDEGPGKAFDPFVTDKTVFHRYQAEYSSPEGTFDTHAMWTEGGCKVAFWVFGVATGAGPGCIVEWPLSFHPYMAPFDDKYTRAAPVLTVEVSSPECNRQYIRKTLEFPDTYDGVRPAQVLKFYNVITPQLTAAAKEEDDLEGIFHVLDNVKHAQNDDPHEDVFGKWTESSATHYNETATPFAIYSWELGYHLPSLIIERLMAAQQFDLALKIARLVFDPSIGGDDIGRCWSFPPFREDCVRVNQQQSVNAWLESGRSVHAAARANPVVYMKRFATKYIELLVAMGDQYFRQDTLESIPLATQMYVEASHVFGPQPVEVPQLGKRAAKTFEQLSPLDAQGNATVDMELEFPFYVEPGSRGTAGIQKDSQATSYIRTTYFCVPGNPNVAALYNRIQDRLYKIRNGMDIDGRKRSLAIWEPPIDYGALQRALRGGAEGIAGLLSDLGSPMPRYRFSYLIQLALELVSELKDTGEKLLQFKEKRDAEALSSLQLRHQNIVLELTVRTAQLRRGELQRAREVQQEERGEVEMRLRYYLALTGDKKEAPQPGGTWQDIPQTIDKPVSGGASNDKIPMSPHEKLEIDLAEQATDSIQRVSNTKQGAEIVQAVPDVSTKAQPFGVGVDISFGGAQVSHVMLATVQLAESAIERLTAESAQAARIGAATRNLQERRLEANTCGRELVRLDKEMKQLDAQVITCDAEIKAQQQEYENAVAQYEWLQSKYTGEELYALLDNTMGTLFHRTYTMATEMSKSARRAMSFELALRSETTSGNVLSDSSTPSSSYWEISRDGQLSGEALYLDLKRMQSSYLDVQTHDFEITKDVSLRDINPLQLLTLHGTGEVDFEVPEVLFDMDFPGHYCRRIASVAVSITCATGPLNSVTCTLSLMKHKYRISTDGTDYAKQKENAFKTDRIPITSVAISKGSQDTGLFDFQGTGSDRYGPFEGAGAISTWRISLPKELRQFDYRTISDVVLHLKYTGFGGGGALEQNATKAATEWTTQDLANAAPTALKRAVAIDLKTERDWPADKSNDPITINLKHPLDRLPFWARTDTSKTAKGAVLLTEPPSNPPTLAGSPASSTGTVGAYSSYSFDSPPALESEWQLTMTFEKTCEYAWLVINY